MKPSKENFNRNVSVSIPETSYTYLIFFQSLVISIYIMAKNASSVFCATKLITQPQWGHVKIYLNSDKVITNVSGVIDAKYHQIALRLVLVHKQLNLGYMYLDPWSNGN
jgi:hypothetical protein